MEALCLKNPLYQLIIGNISGARAPDNSDQTWCVEAAAVTRSQARKSTESKPLKVAEATNQMAVMKDKLIQLQLEDPSLSKYMTKKAPLVKNGKEISHVMRKGILYCITKKVDVEKKELKQVLVTKDLRKKVMEVAHDTMLGGYMGVKKTKDRILTNFYWPGIHQDVVSFCRSCDVCLIKNCILVNNIKCAKNLNTLFKYIFTTLLYSKIRKSQLSWQLKYLRSSKDVLILFI